MTFVSSVAAPGLISRRSFPHRLNPPPPGIDDPPPGGWLYRAADDLPYYWDEVLAGGPDYLLNAHTNVFTTDFNDKPIVPWGIGGAGDYTQFVTHLVGV